MPKVSGRLRRQHLRQLLVLEAALQELVLRQLPVIVLVHLRENVLGPFLGRIRRSVGGASSQHIVDGLKQCSTHLVSTDQQQQKKIMETRMAGSFGDATEAGSLYVIHEAVDTCVSVNPGLSLSQRANKA